MGRLFITLAIITSTLFASQIPERYNTDAPEDIELNKLQKKRNAENGNQATSNTRHDVNHQQYFNANRWYFMSANDGRIGNNYEQDDVGARWPRGQSQNMIWNAGIWVGSRNFNGDPIVSATRGDHTDYVPGPMDTDPYAPEARILKANRWDDSSTSEDYNDWANYDFTPKDSLGNPSITLDQSLFSIYRFEHPERALELKQTIYGGADLGEDSPINNAVFVHYDIENKSDSAWHKTYVSMYCDFDLGSDYENDLVVYDPESQTVYNTNAWNDSFERETVIGIASLSEEYELSSVLFNRFPEGDYENYNMQKGLNSDGSDIIDDSNGEPTKYMFSGSLSDSSGWIDSEPGDKRMLMSFYIGGIEPGETVSLDLVIFAASTDGDRIETMNLGNEYVYSFRQEWQQGFNSVSLFDRPIIETESNYGVFGSSVSELNVEQGSNISSSFIIRNGGAEPLNLDLDMNGTMENIGLNYGETHEVVFSFDAPYLDDPKTIRVPEDYEDLAEALDNTFGEIGYSINYGFNHNDPTASYFDVNGEFYVEHSGDTILVAPGGYYHLNYEIHDRSVHMICNADSVSARTIISDSSAIRIRGRVPNFSFKGFSVENNGYQSDGFLNINEWGNAWSPIHLDISNNTFRNSHGEYGGVIFGVNIHGNISNNILGGHIK